MRFVVFREVVIEVETRENRRMSRVVKKIKFISPPVEVKRHMRYVYHFCREI